jgi:hypothetical protein
MENFTNYEASERWGYVNIGVNEEFLVEASLEGIRELRHYKALLWDAMVRSSEAGKPSLSELEDMFREPYINKHLIYESAAKLGYLSFLKKHRGWTLGMIAPHSGRSGNKELIDYLLSMGGSGMIILGSACFGGQMDIINYLTEDGSNARWINSETLRVCTDVKVAQKIISIGVKQGVYLGFPEAFNGACEMEREDLMKLYRSHMSARTKKRRCICGVKIKDHKLKN